MVNFSYYYLLDLLPGLAIFALGLFAIFKNKNDALNLALFFFTIPIFVRGLIEPLFRTAHNLVEARAWDIVRAPTLFIMMGLLLHFCTIYYDRRNFKRPLTYLLIYTPIAIQTFFGTFTNLIDFAYYRSYFGWFSAPGPYYALSYLTIMIYMVTGMAFVFLAARTSPDPFKRRQAQMIILGTLAPALIGSVSDLVIPLLGIRAISLITASSLFITIFIFVAITRYRLAQVSPNIATKTIAFTLPAALVTTNFTGYINYSNRSALTLFRNSLVNRNLFDLSTTKNLQSKLADFIAQGSLSLRFEAIFQKRDRTVFPAEITTSLIQASGQKTLGLLWVLKDLSQDQELKAELLGKQDQLKVKIKELAAANEIIEGRDKNYQALVTELNQLRDKFGMLPY